jgi:hypothetical protein
MNTNRLLRSNGKDNQLTKVADLVMSRLQSGQVIKRQSLSDQDRAKIELFLSEIEAEAQLGKSKVLNAKKFKRSLDDRQELELFLSRISAGNVTQKVLLKRQILTAGDREKLNLFLNQLSAQMRQNTILRRNNIESKLRYFNLELS